MNGNIFLWTLTMDRTKRLLMGLDKSMSLVEVGPSHNPLVPKVHGWNTTIVDYTDASVLRQHYKNENYSVIEEVDVIWRSGQMHEAFESKNLHSFDAILSSHSLEHMPDAIGFLKSCERLIKPDGLIRLALPDKRCCFDFFSGLSTSGEMLSAHENGDRVHSKKTSFNEVAYAVTNNGNNGWTIADEVTNLELVWPLEFAYAVLQRASNKNEGEYFDFHAWKFTPSSFALIMEELNYLGVLRLRVLELSKTICHEFFVTIVKSDDIKPSSADLNRRRLSLLKSSMREMSLQIANMCL